MISSTPAVTVVVPTHNRKDHLLEHLHTVIDAASASTTGVEIIVLDNGSTDGTADAVGRAFPDVRIVREERPGASSARNAGTRAARAAVVLFTDDDVEVPRDWVDRMSAPLLEGAADIAVGSIRVDDSLRPPWISPWLLQNFADWPEQRPIDPEVIGANFGALRSVLLEIPFDEQLGAPPYQRHEDTFFGVQAREQGFRIVGVGGAPVRHYFDPRRLQRPALHHLFEAAGRGSAYVWYHWAHGVAPHLLIKAVVFRLQRLATLPWTRRHPTDRDFQLVTKIAFVEELRRIEGTPRHYPSPETRLGRTPTR